MSVHSITERSIPLRQQLQGLSDQAVKAKLDTTIDEIRAAGGIANIVLIFSASVCYPPLPQARSFLATHSRRLKRMLAGNDYLIMLWDENADDAVVGVRYGRPGQVVRLPFSLTGPVTYPLSPKGHSDLFLTLVGLGVVLAVIAVITAAATLALEFSVLTAGVLGVLAGLCWRRRHS